MKSGRYQTTSEVVREALRLLERREREREAALLQLKAKLKKQVPPAKFLPRAISVALVAAQCSELFKMVEQASLVHLVAALLLLAIVVANRSGAEAGID